MSSENVGNKAMWVFDDAWVEASLPRSVIANFLLLQLRPAAVAIT